jgi:hypothetical protein
MGQKQCERVRRGIAQSRTVGPEERGVASLGEVPESECQDVNEFWSARMRQAREGNRGEISLPLATHLYVSRLPSSRSMYSRSSIASIPFLTSGTRGWNRALSWSTVSAINCWCFIVLRDFMMLYACEDEGTR